MRFQFGSGGLCEEYAYWLMRSTKPNKWEGWWAKLFSLGIRLEEPKVVWEPQ